MGDKEPIPKQPGVHEIVPPTAPDIPGTILLIEFTAAIVFDTP
jgi:hypothetical protein